MAIWFEVLVEHRLVVAWGEGHIDPEQMYAYRDAVASHPGFEPSFSQLADLRNVEMVPDFRQLAEYAETDRYAPEARRAFVAPDDAHFGTFRAYDAHLGVERSTVVPFRTLSEACAWLEVPLSAVAHLLPPDEGASTGAPSRPPSSPD